MSKTKELLAPRHEVEGGKVEWHENHYKITPELIDDELEEVMEEVHEACCECFDCIPPLTPLEKMQHPFKRKYPDSNFISNK